VSGVGCHARTRSLTATTSSARSTTRTATDRVGNYTQISRKLIQASGTLQSVDRAGMRLLPGLRTQQGLRAELKRDMESTLVSNAVAVAGGTTTARKTAGLGGWIITNSYQGTGTTAAAPVMSSGGATGTATRRRLTSLARRVPSPRRC